MSSNAKVTIIILVDGLGWSLVEQAGFLSTLLQYRAPIPPVTGYSSAAIPALLTGEPPSVTGKWMLFGRERSGAGSLKSFALLSGIAKRHPAIDQWLRKIITWWQVKVRHWPPHFSCFEIPFEKFQDFQFEDVDMGWAPRHVSGYPTIFEKIESSGHELHLFGFPTPDEVSLRSAQQLLQAGRQGIYMLYLWQLDSLFHTIYRQASRVNSILSKYENDIDNLYQAALQKFKQINVVVVSDHGMTSVIGTIDAVAILGKDPCLASSRTKIFLNSTLLQAWCEDSSMIYQVREALASIPHAHILNDEELQCGGIFFEDRRFGDIFVQLDEGWVFTPCYFGKETPAGMHGYDPMRPNSWAVWLSNVNVEKPRNLYEVHEKLAQLTKDPNT